MDKLTPLVLLSVALIAITNSVVHGTTIVSSPISSNQLDPFPFAPEDVNITELSLALRRRHPHADLDVIEIIELHEYSSEVHIVQTDDGYLLEMHRISGNSSHPRSEGKPAVLLLHGILSSSMDWVIAGPKKGFAFLLADAGYDVWMGNVRGNVYSRQHKKFKADSSRFWSFSWHEIGVHDLPAMINHVLKVSGQEKLYYVGHSQGSTAFFVMASELPQYNDKIHAMFSLAPVAYCSHMKSPIFQALAQLVKPITLLTKLIGVDEFKPTNTFFSKFTSTWCQENIITQPLCKNVLFLIGGFSNEQIDLELLPAVLSHLPAGASVNQFVHYAQIIKSGQFRQMDLGWYGNLAKYRSFLPPSYNLKNVRAPVALHYSINDWLSSPTDVQKLYSKLANPIGKFRVPNDRFSHLDYLWAKDVKTLIYDKIMSIMLRYKS